MLLVFSSPSPCEDSLKESEDLAATRDRVCFITSSSHHAATELLVDTPAVDSRSPWKKKRKKRQAVYSENSHHCNLHLEVKLPLCFFFFPISRWIVEKNHRLLPCQAYLERWKVCASFLNGVRVVPWRWMFPVSVLLCCWGCTEPAEILANALAYV